MDRHGFKFVKKEGAHLRKFMPDNLKFLNETEAMMVQFNKNSRWCNKK